MDPVFKKVAYYWTEKEQWYFCVNERSFMSMNLTLGSLERPQSAWWMASFSGHFSILSQLRASKRTSGLYKIPSLSIQKHPCCDTSVLLSKNLLMSMFDVPNLANAWVFFRIMFTQIVITFQTSCICCLLLLRIFYFPLLQQ